MAKQIENVEVTSLAEMRGVVYRCALCWTFEGLRYHVWMDKPAAVWELDRSNHNSMLYKNPPTDTPKYMPVTCALNPAYFNTIKMSLDGATARWMIPQAMAQFEAKMAEALAAYARAAAVQAEADKNVRTIKAMQTHAELLHAAVERAFMALGRAGGNVLDSPYRAEWERCREVLACVEAAAKG